MKVAIDLTIIYIKQTLSQMLSSRKSKLGKNLFFIGAMFLVVVFAIGFAFYGVAEQFSAIGQGELVLFVGLLFSIFTSLLVNVNDAQNYYYKNKDYPFLSSLPIRQIYVILAKYFSAYFISFVYSFVIVFPAYVVYFIFNPVTVPAVLYGIVALFLLPTFSQLVGSIFASIINLITIKFKNKTLVSNILTIIFTVALIAFIFISSNSDLMTNLFTSGIPLWVKIIFSQDYFLYSAMTSGFVIDFVIFLAISIAFACISIGLITISYKKINTKMQSASSGNRKKPLSYKQNSITLSLMKKEAHSFFSSAVYMINCLSGLFLLIALSITLSIAGNNMTQTNALPSELIACLYVFSASMVVGMIPPSASSISIEGKRFLLLKSLPISFEKLCISKILFSFLISLPFIVISNIIFVCVFPLPATTILMIFLVTILSSLTFSVLGFILNLKWPRMYWQNQTQAVKQGLSVFLTVAIGIASNLIPILLYFFLYFEIDAVLGIDLFILIYLAVLLIVLAGLILVLAKKGKKMYAKIY